MDLQIIPKKLSGTVTPPPSKSIAHRLLIAAALSGGISVISNLADSQDIQATRRCLAALGAWVEDLEPGTVRSTGWATPSWRQAPPPFWTAGSPAPPCAF